MTGDDDLVPRERVLTMQIICAALMMGVLSLMGVSLFLVMNRNQPPAAGRVPMVSYIAGGMLFMNTCLALLIPNFMARAAVTRLVAMPSTGNVAEDRRVWVSHLLGIRQSALIVAWALFESVGMTAGVGFMIEAFYPVLGVAVAALALIAVLFPTQSSLDAWMRRHLSLIEESRQRSL